MSTFLFSSIYLLSLISSQPQSGQPIIDPNGPDLVCGKGMQESLSVREETYAWNACELNECLSHLRPVAQGTSKTITVLRFNTAAANIGKSDFILGNPYQSNLNFVYDPCHDHYHFEEFAQYEVFARTDTRRQYNLVSDTGKRAFCLMDSSRIENSVYTDNFKQIPRSNTIRSSSHYTCINQGISKGYQDVYGANLDCQYVDITHLPNGQYNLVITLNPSGHLIESNYSNNACVLHFTLPFTQSCGVDQQGWLGDGYCDGGLYNTAECGWDHGDCCEDCCQNGRYQCGVAGYNCLDPNCEVQETGQIITTQQPVTPVTPPEVVVQQSCQNAVEFYEWVGDGYCDGGLYNIAACNYDGGDCCQDTCPSGQDYACGTSPWQCINPASPHYNPNQ